MKTTILSKWEKFSQAIWDGKEVGPTQHFCTLQAYYAGFFDALVVLKTEISRIEDEDEAVEALQKLLTEAQEAHLRFIEFAKEMNEVTRA